MSAHTKGMVDIQRGRGSLDIGFPNGELVELHGSGGSLSLSGTLCAIDFLGEPQQANARRIVALWNAAEELGLTTEAIEAGAIQEAFDDKSVLEDVAGDAAWADAIRSLTKESAP